MSWQLSVNYIASETLCSVQALIKSSNLGYKKVVNLTTITESARSKDGMK